MTVSAVVVAYHTAPADLTACLASLAINNVSDVVVVDNSPNPDLEHIVHSCRALYLPPPRNSGFATAANLGASHLTAECLLFLNPDACLEQGAIAPACQYMSTHARCGAVGLLLSSPAGTPELKSFGAPVTPLSLITRRFVTPAAPTAPRQVGWASGGALLVRQRAWQEVGGFDASFFLYWEDVDLCRRLADAGWQTVLLPRPGAIHRRGASLANRRQRAALYDQSADKYFAKHYAKVICWPLRYLRLLYRRWQPASDS